MAMSSLAAGPGRMLCSSLTQGMRVARGSNALRSLLAPASRAGQRLPRGAAAAAAAPLATDAAGAADAAPDATIMSAEMTWPSRSHGCGAVTEQLVGQEVTICGWVDGYRNFGGVLFLDIRDHTGLIQASPGQARPGGRAGGSTAPAACSDCAAPSWSCLDQQKQALRRAQAFVPAASTWQPPSSAPICCRRWWASRRRTPRRRAWRRACATSTW
jgi:hypothetical protein